MRVKQFRMMRNQEKSIIYVDLDMFPENQQFSRLPELLKRLDNVNHKSLNIDIVFTGESLLTSQISELLNDVIYLRHHYSDIKISCYTTSNLQSILSVNCIAIDKYREQRQLIKYVDDVISYNY